MNAFVSYISPYFRTLGFVLHNQEPRCSEGQAAGYSELQIRFLPLVKWREKNKASTTPRLLRSPFHL